MIERTGRLARLLTSAEQLREQTLGSQAGLVDSEARLPVETLARLWDQGFLTLFIPREYDGQGASLLEAALVVEELARGCPSTALLVVIQSLGTLPILIAASPDQKQKWLNSIVHSRKLLSFALSEPEGDDSRETRATREADHFLLSGRKALVTNAGEADWLIVFAATDPQAGLKAGLSAFLLERGAPGLLLARTEPRLGLRGLPPADLVLDACAVSPDQMIGPLGQGYALADSSLQPAGVLLAALAVGLMQATKDLLRQTPSLARLVSGEQKSHPAEHLLAEIAMTLEAGRALTYQAAGDWEAGWTATAESQEGGPKLLAAHAKCFATDSAVRVLQAAIELSGPTALLRDHPLSRLLRDAQCLPVLLRPNPSQRKTIARSLLK